MGHTRREEGEDWLGELRRRLAGWLEALAEPKPVPVPVRVRRR